MRSEAASRRKKNVELFYEAALLPEMDKALRTYFRKIGRKGGKAITPAKIAACRLNAKAPRKRKAA